MKQSLRIILILSLIAVLAFANPNSVLADEGESDHGLKAEVNGYHITLFSQNEWAKGANTIVVTITDAMGMPVSNADVEILIAQKQADSHSETDTHEGVESDAHATEAAHAPEPAHDSMPAMDQHEEESPEPMAHEEETAVPLVMNESHEHGEYIVETDLQRSGKQSVEVYFHVNGEMMQADFLVDVRGMASKTIVLWSFLLLNIGLVVSAGVLKNQTVTVKGK